MEFYLVLSTSYQGKQNTAHSKAILLSLLSQINTVRRQLPDQQTSEHLLMLTKKHLHQHWTEAAWFHPAPAQGRLTLVSKMA